MAAIPVQARMDRDAPAPPDAAPDGCAWARSARACWRCWRVFACGVWIGVDWFRYQPDPEFYADGVRGIRLVCIDGPGDRGGAGATLRPALESSRVLAVVLAAAPVLIVARDLIDRFLSWRWAIVAALGLLLYFIGYGRARSPRRAARGKQALVSGIVVMESPVGDRLVVRRPQRLGGAR